MAHLRALTVCIAALCSISTSPAASQAKPNIVILVADDLGWKDVGFHGAEFPTPHIDRIAAEGVELSRFYATPVCSPTRVGLMTGKHPIRFGLARATIKEWTPQLGVPSTEETVAEMLARAGYSPRGAFGKWHLGWGKDFHPYRQGFTDFVGHYGGSIDYFKHTRAGMVDWHHGYSLSDEQGYSTQLIGEHAVRFVETCSAGQPFFLYVSFNAIHTPNHVLEEHMLRNAKIEPLNRREKAAMTTSMDDEIGKVLGALDNKGIANETLVLFFSDNGGVPPSGSSNEPLRGRKHTVYEGGIRVAAAARWPAAGISGGSRITAPLSILDVFPTLIHVSGLTRREGGDGDGKNVIEILQGKVDARDDFEFYAYFNGKLITGNDPLTDAKRREHTAVIDGEWKLLREGPNLDLAPDPASDAKLELFHLRDDPNEGDNVAAAHPERVSNLLEKIVRFRRLKPADATPIPLYEPAGWKPPKSWRVAE